MDLQTNKPNQIGVDGATDKVSAQPVYGGSLQAIMMSVVG